MMTSFNHRKETRVKWFGHVQDQQGLPRQKAILQGTVQGGRRRGCQKNCWENNIFEWTERKENKITKSIGGKEVPGP